MRGKGHGSAQSASIGQALLPKRKESGREVSSPRALFTGVLDLRGPKGAHGNLDRDLIQGHGGEGERPRGLLTMLLSTNNERNRGPSRDRYREGAAGDGRPGPKSRCLSLA